MKNIVIVYYTNTEVMDEFKTENKELLGAMSDEGIAVMYVQSDNAAGCRIESMVMA